MNEYILELLKQNDKDSKRAIAKIKEESLTDEYSIIRAYNYLQQVIHNTHDNKLLLKIYSNDNT